MPDAKDIFHGWKGGWIKWKSNNPVNIHCNYHGFILKSDLEIHFHRKGEKDGTDCQSDGP